MSRPRSSSVAHGKRCREHGGFGYRARICRFPGPTARASARSRGGERDTLTSRRFASGSLKVVAARAPRNLRRHTARILLVDEADAMEIGPEGYPIRLAERRTLSSPIEKSSSAQRRSTRIPATSSGAMRNRIAASSRCRVRNAAPHRDHVAAYPVGIGPPETPISGVPIARR